MLARLAESISLAQAALLAGCLPEFESAIARMGEFGRRLSVLLYSSKDNSMPKLDSALIYSAQAVRHRARVFASVLRRMRQTTTALDNAMRVPLIYEAVADNRRQRVL